MSHRHVNKRTGVVAGAAAVAITGAAILLPDASASTDRPTAPRTFSAPAAGRLATALKADIGDDRAAGWYLDGANGHLVMNVLSEDDAAGVRAKGAVARVVRNSLTALRSGTRTLRETAAVPGTAWSIDPTTNKIVVLADRTVTGARMATLTGVTDKLGADMVTVRRSRGEFKRFDGFDRSDGFDGFDGFDGAGTVTGSPGGDGGPGDGGAAAGPVGGSAIFGGGARCSLGFNVTVQGAPAFLTAGHCGNDSRTWSAEQGGGRPLGTVADSRFPRTDFALVTYDDPGARPQSAVGLGNGGTRPITRAAEAAVGMRVQRSGSTTGLHDGTVTGLDATVNYGNGDIVSGLIQTDVCAEPGDSGGAMFSGDAAVGLTSGGSGDCTQGGETFFQPVPAALAATGAQIGSGDGDSTGGGSGTGSGGPGDSTSPHAPMSLN
ncbi:serine protease AlgW [Streptomyces sp. NBRC 110611]|uniref:S1 family peptidase n=1 Tax=Streptomyces sp. NBRC 110611 TaxID=1621259 RepID=UPI0008560CBA|nr:S1 family peptidase [Streptomyces sp. NBRC 110611]GAU70164.1 serine protease AlgW [Streptomyces sp. NBRC 110611]